jgi:hypothetical protein
MLREIRVATVPESHSSHLITSSFEWSRVWGILGEGGFGVALINTELAHLEWESSVNSLKLTSTLLKQLLLGYPTLLGLWSNFLLQNLHESGLASVRSSNLGHWPAACGHILVSLGVIRGSNTSTVTSVTSLIRIIGLPHTNLFQEEVFVTEVAGICT